MLFLHKSKAVKVLSTAILAVCALFMPADAIASATTWKGSAIGDVANGTTDVFLYNVKTGKFLGKGGKWGTQAVISEVGIPFTITSTSNSDGTYTYTLTSHTLGQGSSSNAGMLGFTNGANSVHDTYRFFTDRTVSQDQNFGTYLFTFTTDTPADDNKGIGENFYKISLTSSNAKVDSLKGTFYMVASTDTEFNNIEAPMGTKTEPTDDSEIWQIVTLNDRKDAFKEADFAGKNGVGATFLLHDQDFSRNQTTISYWKSDAYTNSLTNGTTDCYPYQAYQTTYTYTYKLDNAEQTHTYTSGRNTRSHTFTVEQTTYTVTTKTPPSDIDKTYTKTVNCGQTHNGSSSNVEITYTLDEEATTSSSTTYYVGNGYPDYNVTFDKEKKATIAENLQGVYGNKWTANIHGANGNVAQMLEQDRMVREGWYEVTCQAFTTANEGTVQLFASVGKATPESEDGFYTVDINKDEDMSVDEADSVTYVMAYDRLHGDNENAHTYKIRFKVGKDANDAIENFYFGIIVKDAGDNAWTCFDNFTLKYYGNANHNLYLDETKDNIDYIQKQAVAYDVDGNESTNNRTLYLNRSFNLNTWNSIVLPVSLTAEQVKNTFGSDVILSEFYGACNESTPNRIYFKEVDLSTNSATAMKAGNLYLIKPTVGMTEKKVKFNVITGTQTTDGVTTNTEEAVTLDKAYIINQVNVEFTNEIEASVTTASKGNNYESYGDENKLVKFVGTYVAGTQTIPANSYVIAGNTSGNHTAGYWYYRTTTTKTKGFRGWLETYKNEGTAKLEYVINGVLEIADGSSSTAVDGVLSDTDAVRGNVYNLNGQLVRANATTMEGLSRGIYVVNGKKYVVK